MKKAIFLFLMVLCMDTAFAQRVSSTHFFYFDSRSSKLIPMEEKELNAVCDTLKGFSLVSVSVTGHTDDTDSEENNLVLSEERAKSVKSILLKNKIPESIISIAAMGESIPLESNTTEKGKARNRRVEVKVVYE